MVTGGFDFFALHLQARLGLDFAFANRLEIKDGALTGRVLGTIIDAVGKAQIVNQTACQQGIMLDQVVVVGDGADNALMLGQAGLGIAYNAKRALDKVADVALGRESLANLFHLLGIAESAGRPGLRPGLGVAMGAPLITAIHASPRREGNTSSLLGEAVAGARQGGARVEEVFLRGLKISPCLELYGCKQNGRCAIQDDFRLIYDLMLASQGIMLASPIFFYTVSAQAKLLMDRCQSLWVKKYWIDQDALGRRSQDQERPVHQRRRHPRRQALRRRLDEPCVTS